MVSTQRNHLLPKETKTQAPEKHAVGDSVDVFTDEGDEGEWISGYVAAMWVQGYMYAVSVDNGVIFLSTEEQDCIRASGSK